MKDQLFHDPYAGHKFADLNVYFNEARNWIDLTSYTEQPT